MWPDGANPPTREATMDCWHDEIDQASTESEVASRARDYLCLWAPAELEPVTQGWRELRVDTAEDIRVIRSWLVASPPSLHDLAGYFWHAAERIEHLRRSAAR